MTVLVSILFILLLIVLAVFAYDLWRNYLAKLSSIKLELAVIIAVFTYFL